MISKYYSIDNVPFDEITIRLYGMQEDLLSYDSYYQTIKNYLSSGEHNDWDILTAGKEKFGTNFSFIKSKLDDIKLGKDEVSLSKIF